MWKHGAVPRVGVLRDEPLEGRTGDPRAEAEIL